MKQTQTWPGPAGGWGGVPEGTARLLQTVNLFCANTESARGTERPRSLISSTAGWGRPPRRRRPAAKAHGERIASHAALTAALGQLLAAHQACREDLDRLVHYNLCLIRCATKAP